MSFIAFLLFVLVVVNATTTTADARLYRYSVDHPPVFEHTPKLANPTLDCAIKELAWNYSSKLIPIPGLKTVFDALQLTRCGLPEPVPQPKILPFSFATPAPVEFYVSSGTGNDNNNGSKNQPFKTIPHALEQIRGARSTLSRRATLFIMQGDYYLSQALVLTPNDNNLSIVRFQNDNVRILGSAPLPALNWQPVQGQLWKAAVPSYIKPFTTLFVANRRAIRAREPNGNPETSGTQHWFTHAHGWKSPKPTKPAYEVHDASPIRNNSYFRTFEYGIGGPVKEFVPPESYWGLANPTGGAAATYRVPSGVIVDNNKLPPLPWSGKTQPFVSAMHCGYWGSWVFSVSNVQASTNNTIEVDFERGGFQEARGCSQGALWFIENAFEFLDSPNEWLYDEKAQTLYYYANQTSPSQLAFSVTQQKQLLAIRGSMTNPVEGIIIGGLTFGHTEPTFMDGYQVPSGGDVSIHRGATMFIEGSIGTTIQSNRFDSVGGNAVFVSNFNRDVKILSNEFVWTGENAIALVGSSEGIDGTNGNQPRFTTIRYNLIHELGIFTKQCSAIFQSVACQSIIEKNVLFNGPRAGINLNDEFGGSNYIVSNVGFNMVRETGDHGVFNSWNRLPYVTNVTGQLSVFSAQNYLSNNFFISNYASNWPIDHDDGSAHFMDTNNFLVYGGAKYFLGSLKELYGNVYVNPDVKGVYGTCALAVGQYPGIAGWGEAWENNTCILSYHTTLYQWDQKCNPNDITNFLPALSKNVFYTPNGNIEFTCGKSNFTSLASWTATPDHPDRGSQVFARSSLSTADIIAMGKALLK